MKEIYICSEDQRILDAVFSVSAAQDVPARAIAPARISEIWDLPNILIIGADLALSCVAQTLTARNRIYLVGFDAVSLGRWSVPLQAPVIPLPQGAHQLAEIISAKSETSAVTIGIFGGSGGIGSSTLAASLAVRAGAMGKTVTCVDLDPLGGGIDLLFGLERESGWRWSQLRMANGVVADIVPQLPKIDSVSVLAMDRNGIFMESDCVLPVIESLQRNSDLLILDIGRSWPMVMRDLGRKLTHPIALVGANVRSVAATKETIMSLGLPSGKLVIRNAKSPDMQEISEVIGWPLLGTVPWESRLATWSERGEPPGRGRTSWSKTCDRLLAKLLNSS